MAVYTDRIVTVLERYGHYEIYVDCCFYASCDTYTELSEELREIHSTYGYGEEIYL